MILRNPLEQDLEVQINGTVYKISAKSEKDLPEAVATHWKNKLHSFLEVVIPSAVKTLPKVEDVKELEEKEVKKAKK